MINTHFHADFVSGHLELLSATGAWIGFGAAADTDYPIRRFAHGEHVSLGEVDLEVQSTPGHTWESISLVVRETPAASPTAVLTGDSLFIGDVGRPDLVNLGSGSSADLARAMYRTIHQTLLALPDSVVVLPAHGAGSSCGKNLSAELSSTIGEQRRSNPSVQPMTVDAFVALITEGQPAVPEYFHVDAALNKSNRPLLEPGRVIPAMSAAHLRAELAAGIRVLDTRTPDDFAAAHLRSSVNVGFDGRFAETSGMVAGIGERIVLVSYPGEEQTAALRMSRIGSDVSRCRSRRSLPRGTAGPGADGTPDDGRGTARIARRRPGHPGRRAQPRRTGVRRHSGGDVDPAGAVALPGRRATCGFADRRALRRSPVDGVPASPLRYCGRWVWHRSAISSAVTTHGPKRRSNLRCAVSRQTRFLPGTMIGPIHA